MVGSDLFNGRAALVTGSKYRAGGGNSARP
jgi:hypothetical protein